MKYWNRHGKDTYKLGMWTVMPDWATGKFDVYLLNKLKAEGFATAPEAMAEAERMGA